MLTKAFSTNVIKFVTWKNDWFARIGIPHRYGYQPFGPKNVNFPVKAQAASEQAVAAHNFDGSQQTAHSFVDLKMCKDNYILDVDGNRILDLTCPVALGYNHDSRIEARLQEHFDRFLQGRVDCSMVPPEDYADLLREYVMPVAPNGTHQVHLSDGTITSANETAVSVGLMQYAMKHRRDYTKCVAVGFESGSHGSSVAMLSASDAAVNNAGVPTYQWPTAPLPQLKYPLAQNEKANKEEEERCLAKFCEIVGEQKAHGADVGAVIIEPITAYGNKSATPMFYKQLRAVCKEHGIPFIVDETRSGYGQSGKLWAHDYWYLNEKDGGAPDMVTFGGKAGISGFYSTVDYRLDPHCASFDQDVDMVKLLNFGLGWKEIQKRDLLDKVQDVGSFLKIELNHIQRDKGNLITSVRGNGSMIGFDVDTPMKADSVQSWLMKSGIQVSRIGGSSFGLRPALVLGPSQACFLRNALRHYHPNHDQK